MSVLVKGMKIPKDKPIRIVLNPNGQLFVDHGVHFTEYEAVELPPHGRLIDADALRLLYDFNGYEPTGDMTEEEFDRLMCRLPVIRANIDDAPTIIEAEDEE